MPIYNKTQLQETGSPLDLTGLQFGFGEEVSTAFTNRVHHEFDDQTIANTARVNKLFGPEASIAAGGMQYYPDPVKRTPLSQPEIEDITKERAGLQIPVGAPRLIGELMATMYDDDKNFSLVSEHPASVWGTAGAFGGSFAGAAVSPTSLVPGGFGAKIAKNAFSSIAFRGVSSVAAAEVYGSASARVGTLIGEAAVEGAGFGVGSQLEEESVQQAITDYSGRSYSYIQGLQNVGESAVFGAFLGAGAKSIGISLLGRKVIDHPTHGPIEVEFAHEIPEGAVVRREGGLLNRPEFKNIPEKTKAFIGKRFKPWSKDSDITMKEEATGQMMNGQHVNVDPVMKQGMVDAGADFRKGLDTQKIDPIELDNSLAEAQSNIEAEISSISSEKFVEPEEVTQEAATTTAQLDEPSVPDMTPVEAFNQQKAAKIKELQDQYFLTQSLRDHINDTHEPLTQEDIRAYGQSLKEPGMPNNGHTTEVPPEAEGFTVDDYLNEYPKEQVKSLAETFSHDKEFVAEIEMTKKKISKQKVYLKMVKALTDCILKGGAQ